VKTKETNNGINVLILQSLAITLQVVLDGLATKERSEVVLGKAI
jgi:hypothetical protein